MTIDKAIRVFVEFLNSSWSQVEEILMNRDYTTNEDSVDDWLQANWELLVERKILKINEYLEVYGDGADFNGESSRITDPSELPTYRVAIKAINNNKIFDYLNKEDVLLNNVTFDKIVGFKNGFYTLKPEFKYVLIVDNELERVLAIEDVKFELEKL